MYAAPCSPSSSIFSEMLELNATRVSSKRDYSEEEQLSIGSYDAAKSSPVFFGRYGHKLSESVAEIREGDDGTSTRSSMFPEFDPSFSHPAAFGYVLLDRKPVPPKQESPPLPDPRESKTTKLKYIFYNIGVRRHYSSPPGTIEAGAEHGQISTNSIRFNTQSFTPFSIETFWHAWFLNLATTVERLSNSYRRKIVKKP